MKLRWGKGFAQNPVARAEYRSPTGSFQARPCSSPRRENVALLANARSSCHTFSRPASWSSARWGEERKEDVARSGGSGFGDFCRNKSHPGCGAEQPAISFSKSKAARGGFCSFTSWTPAFAGVTTTLRVGRITPLSART
jgi:hypothetical protein